MITFAIMLTGGLSYWLLKGGGIKAWFPRSRMTKVANALVFGITAYLAAVNPLFGAFVALAMMLGQSPAVFDPLSDVAIANKDKFLWNMVVFERGIVHTVPFLVVGCVFYGWQGLWFLSGLLMPVAYYTMWLPGLGDANKQWKIAEFIYGCILAFPLAMLFVK